MFNWLGKVLVAFCTQPTHSHHMYSCYAVVFPIVFDGFFAAAISPCIPVVRGVSLYRLFVRSFANSFSLSPPLLRMEN